MFKVEKVITYNVMNYKTYSRVSEGHTDENTALKIVDALNALELSTDEKIKRLEAELEEAKKVTF